MILTPIEEENSLALQQEETDYTSSSSSSSRRKHNNNNNNNNDNNNNNNNLNVKRHGKKRKSSSHGVLENENDISSPSKSTEITSSLWLIPIPIILGISFVGSFLILYFFFRRRISKLENEIKELRSSLTMPASSVSSPLPPPPPPLQPPPPPPLQPPPPPSQRVPHAPLPSYSYSPPPVYYDSNMNSRLHNDNNINGTNVPRAPPPAPPVNNAQQHAIPVVPRSSKEEVKILSETEMDRVLEKELAELGSSSLSSSLPSSLSSSLPSSLPVKMEIKDLEKQQEVAEKSNKIPATDTEENIGQVIEVIEETKG